ncbi:MAG TPA: hypothetical protein VGF44_05280 [Terriglobales bacterium]
MSEVINKLEHEFWRPPVVVESAVPPSNPAACQCGTEFMLGAGFCHVCGSPRHALDSSPQTSWTHVSQVLSVLQFQNIKSWLNLPTASLIAFLFGLGCVFGALMTGMIYSAQNFSDFEAIQLWRMQWLLGAVAAFVAAILLKRDPAEK